MSGSPRKRARREAEERAKELQTSGIAADERGDGESGHPAGSSPHTPLAATITAPAVTPIQGEILPPEGAPEPTRTALKRAMRARAQEHAEAAIAVLVANMNDTNLAPEKRGTAANDILAWGFGKPVADIDIANGDQIIVIRKFGVENE